MAQLPAYMLRKPRPGSKLARTARIYNRATPRDEPPSVTAYWRRKAHANGFYASRAAAYRAVWDGRKEFTPSGLTKLDLVKNRRGQIVCKSFVVSLSFRLRLDLY